MDVTLRRCVNRVMPSGEHIILCNFGGRIMSDFEVIEQRFRSLSPGHRKQKMPSLNRVNDTSSLS